MPVSCETPREHVLCRLLRGRWHRASALVVGFMRGVGVEEEEEVSERNRNPASIFRFVPERETTENSSLPPLAN